MGELARSGQAPAEAVTCVECHGPPGGLRCGHCGAAWAPGGLRARRVLRKTPYGRTYLCEDENGKPLAVKEVCLSRVPDVAQLEALEHEGAILAQLRHPRIPRYHASFREGQGAELRLYLAHDYVRGETLARHLQSHRFAEKEGQRLARELLEVLRYLHGLSPKLLHLDVQPENVIIAEDGSASLIGFGSARDLIPPGAEHRPAVHLPDAGRAPPSEASDLYLVGGTVLRALSRRPLEELLSSGEPLDVQAYANVSEGFAKLLERLLATDPSQRPGSAAEALKALDELEAGKARPDPLRGRRRWPWAGVAVAAGLATLTFTALLDRDLPLPRPPPALRAAVRRATLPVADSALTRASVDGKYSTLLESIEVPADRATYGEFRDWGYWSGTRWAGHSNLPPGHWVYVYPRWYIWRDVRPPGSGGRAWGPEQATGAPDTPNAGDISTAWASALPDGSAEWLELTYQRAVMVRAVHVHETYNPGAVVRVTGQTETGEEITLWEGTDPTATGAPRGVSVIPVSTRVPVRKVTVHLDSLRVRGWNEVDAVGLEASDGTMHWAQSARASSTYAERSR